MFVKEDGSRWINLSTCRSVEVVCRAGVDETFSIELRSAIILPTSPTTVWVGEFETKEEAKKRLDGMWQAYRDGEKTWEL